MTLRQASFYAGEGDNIVCTLCAQRCRIRRDERGKCGVRKNIDGKLYSLIYGELVAEHIDPIEKKPLFHILPGSTSLSISTVGCNFSCLHCQNSSISQVTELGESQLHGRRAVPEEIAANAKKHGCKSISYTYVEPTIFYEFAYDCAVEAAANNIKNIFVSNGYLSKEAAKKIAPYLDAINIDLKSFRDEFYNSVCGAKLQPVLDGIRLMRELGVWVEVTTLVIPGHNDSDEELKDIASFIASVDTDIPWHVTGFYPTYKMTSIPPTPLSSLNRARVIGEDAGLPYVYEGNMPGSGGENTKCPGCAAVVIKRRGFSIQRNRLKDGVCPDCSAILPGVWR